jgi:polyisoprenoid-binding protein YceI
MNQRIIHVVLLVMLVVLVAACGGGDAPTPTPTIAPPVATAVPPTATPAPATEEQATEEQATEEQATEEQPAPTAAPADVRTFVIDAAQSEARFVVNEVLLGMPTEVKGATSQLTGTIDIDLGAPANTTVSPIVINARDLKTDRNLRDRAIRRFILQSADDKYQFITFTPTSISGLPAQAQPGDRFTFEVTGDLQIRDKVAPATFSVTLTADSETQITGLAQATVQRATFDLQIPSAPGVADVTEDVRLELAFVARAQ